MVGMPSAQSTPASANGVVGPLTPERYVDEVAATLSSALPGLLTAMTEFAQIMRARCGSSGVALLAGNGGAAALLTHFASEVMSPDLARDYLAFRCIDLTGNSPLLSAVTNDLGASDGIASTVRHLARHQDLLLLVSTSGESVNLLRAAQAARECAVPVLSLVGRTGSRLETASDLSWVAGTSQPEAAQDMCSIALHLLSLLMKGDD